MQSDGFTLRVRMSSMCVEDGCVDVCGWWWVVWYNTYSRVASTPNTPHVLLSSRYILCIASIHTTSLYSMHKRARLILL